MTAQIFDLRGQPIQSVAAPSQAGPRIPGQLRLVKDSSSPEEIVARRLRAGMRLRNAIDLCRDAFGSDRLAEILVHAAEEVLRQAEGER